jgi:hypothetical protein
MRLTKKVKRPNIKISAWVPMLKLTKEMKYFDLASLQRGNQTLH